ncbi:MAG: thiamine pyrophosphate-binding protein, partial [Syntrophales bacterium]|nr:thiamine pyrophosphate-binding protein [Syntrophales bacterium]
MKLKGTQILFEILKQEKVDTIFGYPGGAVLDIYDELYKTDIRHVLVRHEQGAVHAADGYARASGKVGVCLVTSGPGATNTVTGVATANMDSIPLVVFTGQVATHLIGNDAFQECDITGITRPCTKHNFLVRNIDDLTETIRKAFWIARSGRPGPVLVDLPKNVMASETEFNTEPPKRRKMDVAYEPTPETYDEILEMIRQAKRPVLMIGGGIVLGGASTELTAFARKLQIPVTGTLMGLGAFPGTDPLWLGMVGMHGTYYANMSVTNTDLLIIIGARCDDRVTSKLDCFACGAKIIHVDVDESSIEKNVAVDLALVSDAKRALGHLNKMIEERHYSINPAERSDWLNQIQDWKQQEPLRYEQTDKVIKPQY